MVPHFRQALLETRAAWLSINDSGDIVGFGSFKGSGSTGFLLIPTLGAPAPVPEPSTWALILLGFGALGLVGYRQTRRMNQAV